MLLLNRLKSKMTLLRSLNWNPSSQYCCHYSFFLYLLTDVFLFGERMLEINLIVLMISMLIYALYAGAYFQRNRSKFRRSFARWPR